MGHRHCLSQHNGMNGHGALNHRVLRIGVHHVADRINYLIALDPQERRSKIFFASALR